MNTLSLCSGIGGLDLAVDQVMGSELVGYAEFDPSASRVMEYHFPGVRNYGDITQIDWSDLEHIYPEIVTAGYPCQPFSLAGRRKGSDDERHLYPYISEAVRVLRPRYVFLENVAGHRSSGFGEVLGDLSSRGYRVGWTSVRASDVGAPHRRERVFILGRERETSPYSESIGRSAGIWGGGTPQEFPTLTRGGSHTVDWQEYSSAIRRWEHVTSSLAPYPVAHGPRGGRRVSNTFGEWVMGYPRGWISDVPGISLKQGAKLYGNAVVPHAGARALEILLDMVHTDYELQGVA